VKLLDGLLLAVRSETLRRHAIFFDERFEFHLYDMDFCRQAELKSLRMGTWTLSVIHESRGAYNTPSWHSACADYFSKWGS
jgi:GT2 family glycosyltransferase